MSRANDSVVSIVELIGGVNNGIGEVSGSQPEPMTRPAVFSTASCDQQQYY